MEGNLEGFFSYSSSLKTNQTTHFAELEKKGTSELLAGLMQES